MANKMILLNNCCASINIMSIINKISRGKCLTESEESSYIAKSSTLSHFESTLEFVSSTGSDSTDTIQWDNILDFIQVVVGIKFACDFSLSLICCFLDLGSKLLLTPFHKLLFLGFGELFIERNFGLLFGDFLIGGILDLVHFLEGLLLDISKLAIDFFLHVLKFLFEGICPE